MRKAKYKRRRCVFVDVDDTLVVRGEVNLPLVEWLRERKDAGFELVLWSMRGGKHARTVAERFGVADLFGAIISKPGYIVDDVGWNWIKYTKRIRMVAINGKDIHGD